MTDAGYKQFCPVAMAAEVLCTRWTMVLMRELVAGTTRFNELRRGVPKMSPALLSKRLKELELAGVVERRPLPSERGVFEYHLTKAGKDLRPVVEAVGMWGQKWVESSLSLKNLDPSLLMWDMRRNLDPSPLPPFRTVIQFLYSDLPSTKSHWWLVIEPQGEVDLCWSDPGFEINLYVTTDLRTMTSIWMGLSTIVSERQDGNPGGSQGRRQHAGLAGTEPVCQAEKACRLEAERHRCVPPCPSPAPGDT